MGTNPFVGGGEGAFSIAINSAEIAIGLGMVNNTWGSYEIIEHPGNYLADPVVARFNTQTGACLGMHFNLGPPGYREGLTALTTDSQGNYIAGGYMRSYLFANGPIVHPIVGL